MAVPGDTENTLSVKVCPPGAFPASSRTSTTAVTTRISATVVPSTLSSTCPPRLTGMIASHRASTSATASSTNGAQVGGLCQMPTSSRNAVPKMPAAAEVTTA